MKATKKITPKSKSRDDLDAHYDFDYSKAKPNRFAGLPKEQVVVLLDEDLSHIFHSSDEVNNALHSLVHAIPQSMRKRKKAA